MTEPTETLIGRVQSGEGNASHWLELFNAAYCKKLGMTIFPGSLNLALERNFNWFDQRYTPHKIWFGREEFRSQRDVIMLPCVLTSLGNHRGFLWSTSTAAEHREDPWVIEIISDVKLRDRYSLHDGDIVEVEIPAATHV